MARAHLLLLAALVLLSGLILVSSVADTKLYDILGVPPDADERTIKKAYKKLAVKWHPDKNLDNKEMAEEKFRDIAAAYTTLTDAEKREVYDQYGEEGVQQHEAGGSPGGGGEFFGGMDPHDIFSQFFGEGGDPFGGMGGGGGGGATFKIEMDMGDMGDMGGFGDFFGGGMGGMGGGMGGMEGGMGDMGGFGGFFGGMGGDEDEYEDEPEEFYGYPGSKVEKITAQTFPSREDLYVTLVQFYSGTSQDCARFAPKYEKVAESLKGVVKTVAVNCDEEARLCKKHKVTSYPAIFGWVGGAGGELIKWPGAKDLTAKNVNAWALTLVPGDYVAAIQSPEEEEEFLSRGKGGGGKAHGTAWGATVILFTPKSEPSPLYKSIAHHFRGNLAFGLVAGEELGELARSLGVVKVPSLVAVCNGDRAAAFKHEGALKSDPLHSFLRNFRQGKKCAGAVRIDGSTDLSKMRVGQLKGLLDQKGEGCTLCVEKVDYIRRVKEVYGL